MGAVEDAKELGTLIVVVGKAKNLVNKSRFGKQDPFCTVLVGEDKQRTKPIKRGGQHPEWDEELRFTILEDLDDVLVRSESQPDSLNSSLSGAPAPLPKDTPAGVITSAALASKSRKGPLGKKGGKSMKVACYADDAKEPELIGECVVPIDEVLKKGEVDEWYEFLYKDKYSGEIYLELTFYSNDAPPVRRNVPRPAVHGLAGAGQFNPSPSGSLSSAASRHKLAGGLTASGSVSGMCLYIPPYMQQGGRAPSPTPQVPPSNSFAELGLPPGHHPGQPTYPPAQQPAQQPAQHVVAPPLLNSQPSIDALTRPMSSMSLGESYPSRPLAATPAPQPAPQYQLGNYAPTHGTHRHSLGGPSDAPWAQMLPQSQPPPAPTPHPRPMSSNDAVPWEQAQRLEQERLRTTATPLPRPGSEQGYGNLASNQYAHHHRPSLSGIDHRVPSPIPESLRPAAPPDTINHLPPRSQSFSQTAPAPIPAPYPALSPAPIPPPHSNSAPPISPTSSTTYHAPSHSFSALTQPVVDPNRAPSPGAGYYQQQQQQQQPYHGGYQENQAGPSAQPAYTTPTRRDTYPPRPQAYQQTPPSGQTYSSSYGQMPPSGSQYNSPYSQSESQYAQSMPPPTITPQTFVPPQQPSTVEQDPPPANNNGYVPWYQQTQSTTPAPPPAPPAQQAYGQQYTQPPYGHMSPATSQYSSPGPPPVPQARPQPAAPPRPQAVGYYPSDELYAAQRQETQTPQPPAQAPWQAHQSRPSYDQQAVYDAQRTQAYTPVPATSYSPATHQSPHQPGVSAPSPPRQPSWQQAQPPYHTSTPNPQPTSPPFPNQPTAYAQMTGSLGPPPTMTDRIAMTPHPQQHYDQARAHSPQPPTQDQYGQQQQPQPAGYGRAPSPQPMTQAQSYQPPYPSQAQLPSAQSQAQLIPPTHSTSPLPPSNPGRAPSPSVSSTSTAKKDWRSYMAGLSTTPNGGIVPNRTPSPQPPPKDPQQGQWYTPPPSLPNSIVPPEGWKSTLPAQKDGHHWRG
ncbi:hypothetical protein I317_07553 [Kwoniella heveanensis CBS 569]|nr:hypothetical protein I317_07553 [Kwoniella heveanensis CBS 569]